MKHVSETVARMGETLVAASSSRPELFDALALTDAERALVAIDPGYGDGEHGVAARLVHPARIAEVRRVQRRIAGGPRLYRDAVGVFESLDVTARFRERYSATAPALMAPMLDALLASYREWGGSASPPTIAIVDFRGVPTWAEFEMLQARFIDLGVPTVVCDPRDLVFDGGTLSVEGRQIDLVYRRCLINDIVDRPEDCRALIDAYRARAVCVANTLRCKLPHKKAFFSVLTDAAVRGPVRPGRPRHRRASRPVDAAGAGGPDGAPRRDRSI